MTARRRRDGIAAKRSSSPCGISSSDGTEAILEWGNPGSACLCHARLSDCSSHKSYLSTIKTQEEEELFVFGFSKMIFQLGDLTASEFGGKGSR